MSENHNLFGPLTLLGPEILDKYVGASEQNIRNLFKDAEAEVYSYALDNEMKEDE